MRIENNMHIELLLDENNYLSEQKLPLGMEVNLWFVRNQDSIVFQAPFLKKRPYNGKRL